MATSKPRFCLTVDKELLNEIDVYRYEKHFRTRSKTAVDLIRRGLDAVKKEKEAKD